MLTKETAMTDTAYRLICFNKQKKIVYYRQYITKANAMTGKTQLFNSGKREIASVEINSVQNARNQRNIDIVRFKLQYCQRCDCLHNDGNVQFCGACLCFKNDQRKKTTMSKDSSFVKKTAQVWLRDIQKATRKLCKRLLKDEF